MKKFLLSLALISNFALGSGFFGGGGSAGDFQDPVITGSTVNFFSDLLKIENGGDRTFFRGNVMQFEDFAHTTGRGLYINIDNVHPQLTTLGMDQWFEPAGGGGAEGSLVWFNKVGRIGWSAYQQGELPGWHHPVDIGVSRGLHFVASSEAATETLTSNHARIIYGGTVAGSNQSLQMLGVDYFKINNTAGDRYIENHLGNGGIYKTQQNVDAWINDAKTVSYCSAANKCRVGASALSSGTVTVANVLMATGDEIITALKTPGGTLCLGVVKTSFTAATNFILTAIQADGSTCTTDTSTYSWWIVNKQ